MLFEGSHFETRGMACSVMSYSGMYNKFNIKWNSDLYIVICYYDRQERTSYLRHDRQHFNVPKKSNAPHMPPPPPPFLG